MAYFTMKQDRLYYHIVGEGPPVVLLHGVGGNHASWFHQIDAWRSQFQLILVDARGFGNSSDTAKLGRSAFTEDLHALLSHLQLSRVNIVAQSMGAGTGVDFCCRYPEKVESLVIADSLVWLAPPPEMAAACDAQATHTDTLSQLERVLGPTFRNAEPAMSELYLQIASFNRYAIKTLPGVQQRHPPSELVCSGRPICFVVGEEDVLFPPELIDMAHRLTLGSTLIRLPSAGHSAYFESPAAFNDQVGRWLATQIAQSAGK